MKSIWNYIYSCYQGNALLKIGPETPQTTNAIKINAGIIISDSQALIIAFLDRTFSSHLHSLDLPAGPCWSHRAVKHIFWSHPKSSQTFSFPVWHCQATLHFSSVIMVPFPFHVCFPLVWISPAVLSATTVQQPGLTPVTLCFLTEHRSSWCILCLSWPLRVILKSSYLKIAPSNSTNLLPVEEI